MINMSISTVTSLFSMLLVVMSLLFGLGASAMMMMNKQMNLSICLYCFTYFDLDMSILVSPVCLLFSSLVCFISFVVYLFMLAYFDSRSKLVYFNYFTGIFIICMLVLINFNDFFFVMLGWDGLGVTSYFLIAYFQSPNSIYSSSFTILMNRLGDCFIVVFILFWWSLTPSEHYMLNMTNSMMLLLFVALSTKSALFPFSPWLPAAMAAPTPISSLVHSSTLVTAGLFIMIQNSPSMTADIDLANWMLATSMITALYAGLSALLEPDLKKVVALSTLSHLGFIGMAISLSLPHLAMFHLLAHALFKSSLFISIGMMIVSHGHYQDSRVLSSLAPANPAYSAVIMVSVANLMGLPFISGYYSKDLVVEMAQSTNMSTMMEMIIYFNIVLTFCYSIRLLASLANKSMESSMNNTKPINKPMVIWLIGLSLTSIVFGMFYANLVISVSQVMPMAMKMLIPILLLLVVAMFINTAQVMVEFNGIQYFISSILFLSPLWTTAAAKTWMKMGNKMLKMEESTMKQSIYKMTVWMATKTTQQFMLLFMLSPRFSGRSIIYFMVLVLLLFILVVYDYNILLDN